MNQTKWQMKKEIAEIFRGIRAGDYGKMNQLSALAMEVIEENAPELVESQPEVATAMAKDMAIEMVADMASAAGFTSEQAARMMRKAN